MLEAAVAPAFFLLFVAIAWLVHGRHQEPARRRQILRNSAISFVAFVVGATVVRLLL